MKVEKIEQFKGQSFPFLKPVECNQQTLNIIGNVRSSPMNNGQFMFDVVLGTKPTREEYQNFRYWYFDGVKPPLQNNFKHGNFPVPIDYWLWVINYDNFKTTT